MLRMKHRGSSAPAWSRREWMSGVAAALAAGTRLPAGAEPALTDPEAGQRTDRPAAQPLDITQYEPRSMLRVPETAVPRARYPVIDIHTHLTFRTERAAGVPAGDAVTVLAPASELLSVMDRRNVQMMVNLTGGTGTGLAHSVREFQSAHPGRFLTFTEPAYDRAADPGYPKAQADAIARAHEAGARGLKVLKALGLYLRERITEGPLVAIDDPRFDPMWEACAGLRIPVAIHIADPVAFFLPIDRFNERFEELNAHPDWSFHGRDFPAFTALLDARNRLFARHPRTTFVALHLGHHAEDLAEVAASLDRHPNMHVELGARIGELGRQPRAARRFFDRYQDRILFGTDAVPYGDDTPQQVFGDALYQIYYRFLETEDEYFDYAPARVPPQGRWRIHGLGLPDGILKKVYRDNAARLLDLSS
jgi:predicted TIM-barrel fold metal-dependent hydrolase